MKVSVIIPTYCPEDYIYECLDSVCNQSLKVNEYEVIIVINGCKDPYIGQIQKFICGRKYENIKVIQVDKPGVSNARNIGIENSLGEYITFVDDDDIITHNYLEGLLCISSRSCVGCSNSFSFTNSIEAKKENFLSLAFKSCIGTTFDHYRWRKFLSPPVGKLIHREIIGTEKFPISISRSEDSVFCLKISRNIKDMKLASDTCVYYIRERIGSVTRRKRKTSIEIRAFLYIELIYFLVWLKHPFSYNIKFVMSRFAAGLKNFVYYYKLSQK